MRKPSRLSHSSVSLFYKNREDWYVKNASEFRLPRTPQEDFMAIGSGFDARAKSELHAALFGAGSDPKFEFQAIFEDQVEPQNRDWCIENSWYVFKSYKASGAYDDLLAMLQKSDIKPQFEFTVTGDLGGVPFLGKPDCRLSLSGVPIILDWKVRGYCSKSATSPTKLYRLCRDGFAVPKRVKKTGELEIDAAGNQVWDRSKSHGEAHKLYVAHDFRGFEIHAGAMEDSDTDYADQLCAYSWLMGEPVGGEFVGCIDEIVAKPHEPYPLLRVSNLRARIRAEYQQQLLKKIQDCWAAIQSEHIFTDKTKEDSDERCRELDAIATSLATAGGDFYQDITKSAYR